MGASRKLQLEIDRILKRVQEGNEVFDAIWDKVGNVSTFPLSISIVSLCQGPVIPNSLPNTVFICLICTTAVLK